MAQALSFLSRMAMRAAITASALYVAAFVFLWFESVSQGVGKPAAVELSVRVDLPVRRIGPPMHDEQRMYAIPNAAPGERALLSDRWLDAGRPGRKSRPGVCAAHGSSYPGGCFVVIAHLVASRVEWAQSMGYTGESKFLDCLVAAHGDADGGTSHIEVVETATRDELLAALCATAEARKGGSAIRSVLVLTDPDPTVAAEIRADVIGCVAKSGAAHRIVDFFGTAPWAPSRFPWVKARDYLSMAPNDYNTFLGYFLEHSREPPSYRRRQCVVWGKLRRYYTREAIVALREALAALDAQSGGRYDITLVGVVSDANPEELEYKIEPTVGPRGRRVRITRTMPPDEYKALVRTSRCLIGLGDPLLGPSAVEAIAAGTVFVNPVFGDSIAGRAYDSPDRARGDARRYINGVVHGSQHAHLAELSETDPDVSRLVCPYRRGNPNSLARCISRAMDDECEATAAGGGAGRWLAPFPPLLDVRESTCGQRTPHIPRDYTREAFVQRLLSVARDTA